jgi:hypothetical protein
MNARTYANVSNCKLRKIICKRTNQLLSQQKESLNRVPTEGVLFLYFNIIKTSSAKFIITLVLNFPFFLWLI